MAFADVFGRDPLELWLLAGVVVVMLAALARTAWRKRLLRWRAAEADPFLVFPENTVRRPMTPAAMSGLAWAPPATEDDEDDVGLPVVRPPVPPPAATHPAPAYAPPVPPPAATRPAPAYAPPATPLYPPQYAAPQVAPATTPRPAWSSRPVQPVNAPVDEASETIRLPTAADGTVQLLPGMLVMTDGPEIGREFRFLRVGSQAIPELTMGRAGGPPYRHIQLAAATVSRTHARIRYEGGSWHIANLSTTNPLRLNGRELPAMADFPLADGDRIQLGEVELCYRDGRL